MCAWPVHNLWLLHILIRTVSLLVVLLKLMCSFPSQIGVHVEWNVTYLLLWGNWNTFFFSFSTFNIISVWECIFIILQSIPPVVYVNYVIWIYSKTISLIYYYRSRITFLCFVFLLNIVISLLNIILATKCRNLLSDSISINRISRL